MEESLYIVGDRVFMINPLDFMGSENPVAYTVTQVKYSPTYATWTYKLDNGNVWVNEAWLEPDLFGPQYISDNEEVVQVKDKKKRRKELLFEQDYELATLHQAIYNPINSTEVERTKNRLREIREELELNK